MNKKEKLIIALREERDNLPEYNFFGEKNDLEDYDLTILYLETGYVREDESNYDLLYSAVHDINSLYTDYDIE